MKSNSVEETDAGTRSLNMQQVIPGLSEDAFYLMALGSRLKKMLGPASLLHFLGTGESRRCAERTS